MLLSVLALALAQAPPNIVAAPARIPRPPEQAVPISVDTLLVRITAADAVLWQGKVRVTRNQAANYEQSLSQAAKTICPPEYNYGRDVRQSIGFNIYAQDNPQVGRTYRISARWQRPVPGTDCVDSGSRTVQVERVLAISAGSTSVIEGDAGLRIEISRE